MKKKEDEIKILKEQNKKEEEDKKLEEQKQKNEEEFKSKDNNEKIEEKKFKLITKIDLASACRKLISRYLVGVRNDTDINKNNLLVLLSEKEDLWSK